MRWAACARRASTCRPRRTSRSTRWRTSRRSRGSASCTATASRSARTPYSRSIATTVTTSPRSPSTAPDWYWNASGSCRTRSRCSSRPCRRPCPEQGGRRREGAAPRRERPSRRRRSRHCLAGGSGRRGPIGGAEDEERELHAQADLVVVEVDAVALAEPVQPIGQRVRVDAECRGRHLAPHAVTQERVQCPAVGGARTGACECTEDPRGIPLGGRRTDVDDVEEREVGIAMDPLRWTHEPTDVDGALRLEDGTAQARCSLAGPPYADVPLLRGHPREQIR